MSRLSTDYCWKKENFCRVAYVWMFFCCPLDRRGWVLADISAIGLGKVHEKFGCWCIKRSALLS